jgi:putative transposase
LPRRPRYFPEGIPVHLVQRGNNQQVIFTSNHDFAAFANWLTEGAEKYQLAIHAWAFMTNHIHLLATPISGDAISKWMQFVGRHYVRYFNHKYCRTGTLFEGRFKANLVQSSQYFLACSRYIELNPVRALMVADPADYPWSSYPAHAFGKAVDMWRPHEEYLNLASTVQSRQKIYRALCAEKLGTMVIKDIRDASRTGIVLGNQQFRDQIEMLSGIPQAHMKRGPKSKKANIK